MKKLMTITAAVVICAVITIAASWGIIARAQQNNNNTGTLRIAETGVLNPISFFDANNNLTGIGLAIAHEMAKDMGKALEYDLMAPAACFMAVQTGTHDLAIGFTITPGRQEQFYMLDPIIMGSNMIITRQDYNGFNGKETAEEVRAHASNGRVGGLGGTLSQTIAENIVANGTGTAVVFTNLTEMVLGLRSGVIDHFVWEFFQSPSGYTIWTDLFTVNPDIKAINVTIQAGYISGIIMHGNTELKAQLNATIARIIADGTLDEIFKQFS